MRNQLDFALDVIQQEEGAMLHQANLHVAATQLIQSLTGCGPTLIEQNPGAYSHLVNSITKLGREALNFQKYREACAQARSTFQQLRDPKRDLTEEERQAIVDKLDQILGPFPPCLWMAALRPGWSCPTQLKLKKTLLPKRIFVPQTPRWSGTVPACPAPEGH